jgi:hypothetical protein
MTRYFTLQQAERLLPEVETALREAIFLKEQHQQAEQQLRASTERVTMMGGMDFDRGAFLDQRARREASALRLKEVLERIQEFGCLVKDLDTGLIDFPTLFHGQEVYLCWRLGETGIAYWHKVEDGFRGRQPIDRDFLDNHGGEARN